MIYVQAKKTKAKPINVKLDDLILDVKNPRFAELYNGSDSEEDLISYLLYNEAAEDIAKSIVKAGEYYPDRPLWVLKKGKKFTVKDGNRRCSAVKALQLPGKYKLSLTKTTIKELPVLVYSNASDLDERIVEEHAGDLFRKWERISKALEVLKLSDSGKWDDALELDSKPAALDIHPAPTDDLADIHPLPHQLIATRHSDLRQAINIAGIVEWRRIKILRSGFQLQHNRCCVYTGYPAPQKPAPVTFTRETLFHYKP